MVLAHDLKDNQKTRDIQISQDVTFDTMLLSSNTLEGLKQSGFVTPSPIQLHGIPLGKCGFDLLLEAKSGTGKTAVFTVVALEKLDLNKGLQAVILAPTREIAAQICDVLRQIGCQYKGFQVEVVMGGLPVQEDINKFKKNNVHIVVGSPGRLKHLISEQHIDVSAVRLLVLDEADKLMEKSFHSDIKYIHLTLPREKQVILSSATYPESCKEFIDEFVQDAQHICPSSDCILLGIVQNVTLVKFHCNTVIQTRNKFKELLKIIRTIQFKQCLIFCNYRARIGELYKMLTKEKWPAEQLYGAQDQVDRLDALKTLQEYKCRILISTDLAARGIDASNVDLVINFEPPNEWQTYLHRIGRAGRYGSYGMAITILSEGLEEKNFMNILSTANLPIKLTTLWPEDEMNGEQAEVTGAENGNLKYGVQEEDSKELWNIICQPVNTPEEKQEEKIEDFHELLNSYHKIKTEEERNDSNIESFSDLLKSFQTNSLPDTNGFEYKCIKLPTLSTNKCLSQIKNQLQIETAEKIKNTSGIVTNGNGNLERIHDNYEKYDISETNIKHSVTKANNNSFMKQGTNSKSQENKFMKREAVKTNVSELLQNSNLYNKHKFKNYRKQTLSSITSDDCEDKRSKSNPKHKAHSKANTCSKGSSVSYSDSRSHIDSSSSSTDSDCDTEKQHFSNSYIEWYKQLKIRVRQIELAVYIDELSKL